MAELPRRTRLVLPGDTGVGKSAVLRQFLFREFQVCFVCNEDRLSSPV